MPKIKKVYPIKGRRDFYKYVIIDKGSIFDKNAIIAKDFLGKEMYFDDVHQANRVCEARNKVKRISKQNLNK